MAVHQAPLSLGFSRQEHWSGLPCPSPKHESEKVRVKSLSHVRLLVTPSTAAYQAPPSMGFSRQEYWRGVPLPSPYPELGVSNFSFYFALLCICLNGFYSFQLFMFIITCVELYKHPAVRNLSYWCIWQLSHFKDKPLLIRYKTAIKVTKLLFFPIYFY